MSPSSAGNGNRGYKESFLTHSCLPVDLVNSGIGDIRKVFNSFNRVFLPGGDSFLSNFQGKFGQLETKISGLPLFR